MQEFVCQQPNCSQQTELTYFNETLSYTEAKQKGWTWAWRWNGVRYWRDEYCPRCTMEAGKMLTFHRKEQFDIVPNGIKKPLVVIGWEGPGRYSRLFCLWPGGFWIRRRGGKRVLFIWVAFVRRITHRVWNREISRLLCLAYDRGIINSEQLHDLTAMFDPTNKKCEVR